ncbi:MAG: hypothetical protein ACJART_002582 [Maribacter sp.]|jgi:hypothetical protein|tara:strand:+ start:158 stop:739 length:582 start_codon:yes stop_codon:yes gene_type:complete
MKNYLYLFLVALITAGCGSSVSVTSDYDKTTDFSKYKTFSYYGWADNSDKILTQFDKDRIESAFKSEFSKRGMTANQNNGDAIISLYIVVDQKTSYSSYTDHYNNGMYGGMYAGRYRYGYGVGYGMGSSTTTTTENKYAVGTLIVDVFDANDKKQIWQGIGKKTIDEKKNKREERINAAVAKIMKEYPVQIQE